MCLPDFNGDELLKCIIELVKLERDWVPKERGYSLYIRPSLVSLDVSQSAIVLIVEEKCFWFFEGVFLEKILKKFEHFSWIFNYTVFSFFF